MNNVFLLANNKMPHPRHWAHVVDNIYIGSKLAVVDQRFLWDHNIGFIVNCSNLPISNKSNIPTLLIPDFHDADINGEKVNESTISDLLGLIARLDFASDIIHEQTLQGKNILVHCAVGINRSAVTIGYYLKKYKGYTYDYIYKLLREANMKRGMPVLLNRTFKDVLKTA